MNIKRNNNWYKAEDTTIYRKNFENLGNRAVICVYKHVVRVTRRTSEDVTPFMEEYNINTDDQLFTIEEVTQVVDSDCNLTEEEQ